MGVQKIMKILMTFLVTNKFFSFYTDDFLNHRSISTNLILRTIIDLVRFRFKIPILLILKQNTYTLH